MNITELSALLNDPAVFGIRKLPPHFTARRSAQTQFPDGLLAEIADYSLSLNGEWAIHWSPVLELPPEDSAGEWRKIELPATFEMQHFGTPVYLNYGYPFQAAPPSVSAVPPEQYTSFKERNPTATCSRTFRLPEAWSGQLIHLVCYGIQSACRVWINGNFAGYSEDSAGIAEFDVTPFCRFGENQITIQVYKYCSGSYLEDQDCWRFSGIFRDVELHALNVHHVADAVVTADPKSGTIRAKTVLSGGDGCTLELRSGTVSSGERHSCDVSCQLPEFQLWSHEKPNLYPATLILRHGGEICDVRHFRIGFRSFQIADRKILLNSVPIKLRGVNRHELHHKSGRVVRREDMEKDIALIKAANFNAVRNSHYPQPPVWYELCDIHGLYVMDEANLESHGLSYHRCVLPGDDPVWEPAVLDRIRRMVMQNRNHPSILIWSMGNEAGFGNAFPAAREAIRELDARPVHYADMNSAADFDSRTYPQCSWLEDYVNGRAKWAGEHGEVTAARQFTPSPSQKPFIANEYAHAMGNSTGNLAEYWQTFEKYDMLAGGFVWEWCEHALDKDGFPAWAYGGDFGDFPNNANFCCDGLVSSDRVPHPGYYQMRAVQKPFAFALTGNGNFRITSKFYFTDFSECTFNWSLIVNGKESRNGTLSISLPPGETVEIPAPCEVPLSPDVSWRLSLNHNGISMGEAEAVVRQAQCKIEECPETLCKNMVFPHLLTQPEMVFDRVWTDNDLGAKFPLLCAESVKNAVFNLKLFQRGANAFRAELFYQGGEVARVGMRIFLEEVAGVEWFGLGPMQNYCDSRELALTGIWQCRPEKLFFHYAKPQENGHRSDVRYLILTFRDNSKLKITADRQFGFNLFPLSSAALQACAHDREIVPENRWELTLDLCHRGLGGDTSWGCPPMDQYRLRGKSYHGSFLLEPMPFK